MRRFDGSRYRMFVFLGVWDDHGLACRLQEVQVQERFDSLSQEVIRRRDGRIVRVFIKDLETIAVNLILQMCVFRFLFQLPDHRSQKHVVPLYTTQTRLTMRVDWVRTDKVASASSVHR